MVLNLLFNFTGDGDFHGSRWGDNGWQLKNCGCVLRTVFGISPGVTGFGFGVVEKVEDLDFPFPNDLTLPVFDYEHSFTMLGLCPMNLVNDGL